METTASFSSGRNPTHVGRATAPQRLPRRSRERNGGRRPGRECAARLLSSYSSPHVRVNGSGDVMDEPRVPSLVRLQVCGQCMTVWALLMGGGLVLGLLHVAAPPRRKGVCLSNRGTNQTPRPLSGVQRVTRDRAIDLDVQDLRDAWRMSCRTDARQSEFGIRPYSMLMGSMKVVDTMAVSFSADRPKDR